MVIVASARLLSSAGSCRFIEISDGDCSRLVFDAKKLCSARLAGDDEHVRAEFKRKPRRCCDVSPRVPAVAGVRLHSQVRQHVPAGSLPGNRRARFIRSVVLPDALQRYPIDSERYGMVRRKIEYTSDAESAVAYALAHTMPEFQPEPPARRCTMSPFGVFCNYFYYYYD